MRKIIIIFILCLVSKAWGNKISDAYEALSIYDYFKAKTLFYKCLVKYPSESSFGLATIYQRNDNPFSNIDSAAKYITICKKHFKDTSSYALYHINNESITVLTKKISHLGFKFYCSNNSVNQLNHFLSTFYFAGDSLIPICYILRDQIVFQQIQSTHSSDSVREFLLKYPQSSFYPKALKLYDDFEYEEETPQKTLQQLQVFIKRFQKNTHIKTAESRLFELTQQFHSPDSLHRFVTHYSTPLTREAAWKLIYSLSVKKYNKEELNRFLNTYPDYPYNEEIQKEISLSQNILIPLENLHEKFGFIDTLGNWIIKPQYDDAFPFYEGLASVCKNDSCFYIDKEGNTVSSQYYEEAESYKNGIAIVKKDNLYFLLNRSSQIISKGYQDISASSNNLFVCKLNNSYGAINAKGEIIIPFTYNKLGNFKNNYAYYQSTKHYGIVDINNKALTAQWDWVSDVDTNSIAIVKKNNRFGLMTVNEELILSADYDYITYCQNEIYLIVKNNLYGFYNCKEKCFITSIDYDYDKAYEANYYTNGKYFKLIQDDEIALVDANGRYSINFGSYTNLFFAQCDIIRIQKNNKYGFVDRKLKAITTIDFDGAEDFKNDIAIVYKKDLYQIINTQGKSLFNLKGGKIEYLNTTFCKTTLNELEGLITNKGETLLPNEYDSIESIHSTLFYCIKKDDLFLYNTQNKSLKKL